MNDKKLLSVKGITKKNGAIILGLAIIIVLTLMACIPGMFTDYGRKEMFDPWLKPCASHWLGTNALGYDVYAELIFGARQTLLVGLGSAILSMILGAIIGVLASKDGFFSKLANGLINIFVMMPKLVCLIVLSIFFGSGTINTIILISLFSWAPTARNISAKVRNLNEQIFIENLRFEGFSEVHIALYHTIPNMTDVISSRFILAINSCIMMESSLSFLGIGDTYYPSWGTMINIAYNNGAFLRSSYLYILAPGLCIMLVSLAFHLISDYIEHRKKEI